MVDTLIIVGIVMTNEPKKEVKKEQTPEEMIQERIMELPAQGMTHLMHLLGLWENDKQIVTYNADNISKLVVFGNDNGWDVELEIAAGHDYYLLGELKIEKGYHTYHIQGLCDTFDDFASVLDIHALVGFIMKNDKALSILHHVKCLYRNEKVKKRVV